MEIANDQKQIQALEDAGASQADLQEHENQLAQSIKEYNAACGRGGSNGGFGGFGDV